MPLTRAAWEIEPVHEPAGLESLLAALASPDAGTRHRAAAALGRHHAQAGVARRVLTALAARLDSERDAFVREAIFAACGRIGGAAAAAMLAPLVHRDDAGLRGGALEALKHLREDAVAAVDELLGGGDADARLLAVEVMRGWRRDLAAPRLRALLHHETQVNVVGAALDVAAAVGDASMLPAVAAAQARFAGDDFIGFAAAHARLALTPPHSAPRKAKKPYDIELGDKKPRDKKPGDKKPGDKNRRAVGP